MQGTGDPIACSRGITPVEGAQPSKTAKISLRVVALAFAAAAVVTAALGAWPLAVAFGALALIALATSFRKNKATALTAEKAFEGCQSAQEMLERCKKEIIIPVNELCHTMPSLTEKSKALWPDLTEEEALQEQMLNTAVRDFFRSPHGKLIYPSKDLSPTLTAQLELVQRACDTTSLPTQLELDSLRNELEEIKTSSPEVIERIKSLHSAIDEIQSKNTLPLAEDEPLGPESSSPLLSKALRHQSSDLTVAAQEAQAYLLARHPQIGPWITTGPSSISPDQLLEISPFLEHQDPELIPLLQDGLREAEEQFEEKASSLRKQVAEINAKKEPTEADLATKNKFEKRLQQSPELKLTEDLRARIEGALLRGAQEKDDFKEVMAIFAKQAEYLPLRENVTNLLSALKSQHTERPTQKELSVPPGVFTKDAAGNANIRKIIRQALPKAFESIKEEILQALGKNLELKHEEKQKIAAMRTKELLQWMDTGEFAHPATLLYTAAAQLGCTPIEKFERLPPQADAGRLVKMEVVPGKSISLSGQSTVMLQEIYTTGLYGPIQWKYSMTLDLTDPNTWLTPLKDHSTDLILSVPDWASEMPAQKDQSYHEHAPDILELPPRESPQIFLEE